MLQNKSTTIISEVKDFFTSSEKAISTILTILSSLTLSEKHLGVESNCNNKHKTINKILLVVLFPFFEVKDAWHLDNLHYIRLSVVVRIFFTDC